MNGLYFFHFHYSTCKGMISKMSSFFNNIISNAFNHLLEDNTKPPISTLLYLFSGILLGLCMVSNITPFHCGIEWLNNIVWEENLCDSSVIVQLTSLTIQLYIIVYFLRKILVRSFQTLNKQTLSILYVALYTVDDFVLLVSSIFSLIFSFSIFLQMYHIGLQFISSKSSWLYTWILIQSSSFILHRFAYNNSKIISRVLKNYPD